jgi:hypothetical protein
VVFQLTNVDGHDLGMEILYSDPEDAASIFSPINPQIGSPINPPKMDFPSISMR